MSSAALAYLFLASASPAPQAEAPAVVIPALAAPAGAPSPAGPTSDPAPDAPVPAKPVSSGQELARPVIVIPSVTPAAPPVAGNEIVVQARTEAPPGDPMIAINEKSYEAVQAVDDAVVGPTAMAYKKAVPSPVRKGLRNFLSNLTEPVVALNFLLQLKPGKAAETLGRFAVNSTFGVAGLVDVAKTKPFNLPYRRNGLAYTLGFYGVKPGPYLFLPLVGPTTVRDLFGLTVDRALVPLAVGEPLTEPAYVVASNVIKSLDDRVQDNARLREVRENSADPYGSIKEYYMSTRQAEIDALKGRKPPPVIIPPVIPNVTPAPAAALPGPAAPS